MISADNQKDSNTPPALWDMLLVNARIATMAQAQGYGVIEAGAIGIREGRIAWVGPVTALPADIPKLAEDAIDCGRAWITPGLIDCYNHLVYAGHYPQTLEAIAEATRAAPEEYLLEASAKRLAALLQEGVTAAGITSGYGLDAEAEVRLESVVRVLEGFVPMTLATKFGQNRTLPEAYAGNQEAFSEEAIQALPPAQAVMLLPAVFYTLGLTQKPLVILLREHNVPMVLATGCNPLTSPCTSLLLVMNMACRLFGLTPQEALLGVTRHAAGALGMDKDMGTIEVGKLADLALWDITQPEELSYQLGYNPCLGILKNGILRRTRE